jgi:hypothetical protein
MVLAAVQFIRFIVWMMALQSVAGTKRRRNGGSLLDYSKLEFGRDAMKTRGSDVHDFMHEFGRDAKLDLEEAVDAGQ